MAEQADNFILVGRKPSMAYVLAAVTQFTNGQTEIFIKARGKAISRAVDVAEILRKRFLKDLNIKNIEIGTEEKEIPDRGKMNISTISIHVSK